MTRLSGLAIALAAALFTTSAFAGPAEDAFLAKFAGAWTGTGTVSGAAAGTIACKLSFSTDGGALRYTGRCAIVGMKGAPPSQSFSGRMLYNDKTKRYEASGAGVTTVGTKSGATITFSSKIKQMGITGVSVMKLSANSILIDADIVRMKEHYTSHVAFHH